jgi:hypothetical protein
MAILTADMKRVVREQRLGFLATVCEDGNAQSLAKGTAAVCRFRGPAAVHDPGTDGFALGVERLRREGFSTTSRRRGVSISSGCIPDAGGVRRRFYGV